jgi:hypothetical protein
LDFDLLVAITPADFEWVAGKNRPAGVISCRAFTFKLKFDILKYCFIE